jgi:glucokinase
MPDHPARAPRQPNPVLLADIGGTNIRFTLYERGIAGPVSTSPVADRRDPISAIRAFLAAEGHGREVRHALFAVAGPVRDGRTSLTNHSWEIDAEAIRKALGFSSVSLTNDFEATAWAIPRLAAGDVVPVGTGAAVPDQPIAAVGPGTGLGIACLVQDARSPHVIASEGGHASLAASNDRETAVVAILRERFGHVSAERALSGNGLVNLYSAIAALDGTVVPERDAAQITAAALADACPVSRAALDMFCAMLGSVAGDLALIFGARGGVYVAGGMIPRFPDYLARTEFRRRFEAKGRLAGYVTAIPTAIVVHPSPALRGLEALLDMAHGGSLVRSS